MANDLTRLSPHIDEMRTKLAQNSEHERSLVQSLPDELTRFDQGILQGVRTLAAEHEARRAGILDQLEAFATSIGTFAQPREAPPAIEQHKGSSQRSGQRQANGTFHDELEQSLRELRKEARYGAMAVDENRQDLRLLERLADAGKPTPLLAEDLALAKELETIGYVFLVGAYAVITPRGRRLLAELAQPSTKKPPLGFLE